MNTRVLLHICVIIYVALPCFVYFARNKVTTIILYMCKHITRWKAIEPARHPICLRINAKWSWPSLKFDPFQNNFVTIVLTSPMCLQWTVYRILAWLLHNLHAIPQLDGFCDFPDEWWLPSTYNTDDLLSCDKILWKIFIGNLHKLPLRSLTLSEIS